MLTKLLRNNLDMKTLITGGHHFGHKNLIDRNYTGRPFKTIDENDEELIRRWNSVATNYDTIIHLGDFAFSAEKDDSSKQGKIQHWWDKLNGRLLIIVRGNHDAYNCHRSVDIIMVKDRLTIGNLICTHKPLPNSHIPKGFVNAHAHIHEHTARPGHINVCVEQTNYYPLVLGEDLVISA